MAVCHCVEFYCSKEHNKYSITNHEWKLESSVSPGNVKYKNSTTTTVVNAVYYRDDDSEVPDVLEHNCMRQVWATTSTVHT